MADISLLARLINGASRNVDVSANTLIVSSIKVGGGVSNTELTKTILDRMVSLQNGTDVDATYHTHDTIYFTQTQLGSTSAPSGASRIGVSGTPVNYSPSANNVQKHLEAIDSALASAASALDGTFTIDNTSDPTKKIAFSAAGISTGTTRTMTMPDADVNLADVNNAILKNGSRAFTAAQSMGGFSLQNLADPVSGQDAVTLAYMNARLNGLKPKASARIAVTSNINLAAASDPGAQDGVTLSNGDRILLIGQTSAAQNGLYDAVTAADPTTWTRSADMDSLSPIDEVNGAWVAIREGTAGAGKVYVQYGTVATLGTDAINFEFYNPIAGLIGGDMITFSGSTFSVDLAAVSGLESSNPGNVAGQLRIKLEASNPTLQIDGSNQLGVKLSASGAIVAGAGGISVAVDNSTIEINSDALRVKAAGIGTTQLANASVDNTKVASNVFDQDSITGAGGSAAAVQWAPKVQSSETANEALAATTLWALRYAKAADVGFVAGRLSKADIDASSVDNFYVIGLAYPAGSVSAAGAVTIVRQGVLNVPSHGFTAGAPLFLDASGAVTATPPSSTNQAIVRVGMVRDANNIDVQIQVVGVN